MCPRRQLLILLTYFHSLTNSFFYTRKLSLNVFCQENGHSTNMSEINWNDLQQRKKYSNKTCSPLMILVWDPTCKEYITGWSNTQTEFECCQVPGSFYQWFPKNPVDTKDNHAICKFVIFKVVYCAFHFVKVASFLLGKSMKSYSPSAHLICLTNINKCITWIHWIMIIAPQQNNVLHSHIPVQSIVAWQ